jgi:hypothetical protein
MSDNAERLYRLLEAALDVYGRHEPIWREVANHLDRSGVVAPDVERPPSSSER